MRLNINDMKDIYPLLDSLVAAGETQKKMEAVLNLTRYIQFDAYSKVYLWTKCTTMARNNLPLFPIYKTFPNILKFMAGRRI